MVNLTKDQQIKAFVEGIAIGTLASGVEAVTSSKLVLEFAIAHALRKWSYAGQFPSLAGRRGANSIWIGIQKSERLRAVLAAWTGSGCVTPYIVRTTGLARSAPTSLPKTERCPAADGSNSTNCLSNDLDKNIRIASKPQ